ncbi:MAG: bifunctional adenosylcobinamide kinase/adenosylcobinamide-phosphate guanylyltransferase [Candidatus Schekmanbacteria bacterium]|nr:bifunctional adenosylcobinamide kinase/adenosylcobinamide-phosphate guanylyltransferase [Candidatus Schekmanbacteria bacterium]
MGQITLIVGGCRSGKSAYAQELAGKFRKVLYIATACAGDAEMSERIKIHKKQRPAHWQTWEISSHLSEGLKKIDPVTQIILIDCLTLYLNNFILELSEKSACQNKWQQELSQILAVAKIIPAAAIFVSNEVGQGIVPADSISRLYRDLHGAMNQTVAKAADCVYKMEVGIPLKIK